jgi:demethylmenaquinone methyltransferase/2-methoxy-6-polyprenyl-1,4-benzoquinol methylase
MFGAIARTYDLLNRLLSLGFDLRWRRRAVREIALGGPGRILDLCGGTGDLTVAAARAERAAWIVCCDFAHPMLSRAAPKFRRKGVADRCVLVEGDGLRLPFASGSFDAVTVAFGVRNFVDRDAGFREILRVLRPGGRLIVLEFSTPAGPVFGRLYRLYLNRILPRIGDATAGHEGPYGYLARTIGGFPEPPALAGMLRDAGFAAAGWTPLTGGIVCVHTAVKGL